MASDNHSSPPSHTDPTRARLALADGAVFAGTGFGRTDGPPTTGEVVFNTAMAGYQESLTDPSYRGQILVQTFPLIGNTGANGIDMESPRIQAAGLVVRELAALHSNYRATKTLGEFLSEHGILGITGVDTRALTRRIREAGAMGGAMTADESIVDADLVAMARGVSSMAGQNLAQQVSPREPTRVPVGKPLWRLEPIHSGGTTYTVVALDCGAKRAIYDNLLSRGCAVIAVPFDTSPEDLLRILGEENADGLFISNGPGDPAAVDAAIASLKSVLDVKQDLPTFGICLGNQLLALAAGAETYKLKFGHRGANQPVLHAATGHVEITSQNHGFAVTAESLQAVGGEVTHTHLNDHTVAGFRLKDRPVFAVQHHPEASPGPHESEYLFDAFVRAMRDAMAGARSG
ncbi:MAG: glutamine-hydrolyzing carbamoyl-phosphate synthase small subunit [Phycisphaerales bacterium]|nr:glutamine-hydrolyzing carbamoyl-phosphate synthase small subunit [Phycisphaerales bacterium]